MQPVRWGVLGVAAIATKRAIPAMRNVGSLRLEAIASRSVDKAREASRTLGIPRHYGSYEALLDDPAIDAVYVPLPNPLHLPWSVRALEAGKHVLCEKPLCLAAEDVGTLIAVRERTGRHVEEAFSYRNHPQWAKIREVLDAGTIGVPRAVHCTLAMQFLDPADIRNRLDAGGGALYDTGSYAISACSAVYRRAPERVVVALDRDPAFRTDRLSTALLDYGGAHATFTVATQSGPSAWGTHQQFSVVGSTGWLTCDFPFAHGRPTACHVFVGDATSVGSFPSATYPFPPVDQYALQFDRFSRLVAGEAVPTFPIEDARTTVRVLEALFASERSGRWEGVGA